MMLRVPLIFVLLVVSTACTGDTEIEIGTLVDSTVVPLEDDDECNYFAGFQGGYWIMLGLDVANPIDEVVDCQLIHEASGTRLGSTVVFLDREPAVLSIRMYNFPEGYTDEVQYDGELVRVECGDPTKEIFDVVQVSLKLVDLGNGDI